MTWSNLFPNAFAWVKAYTAYSHVFLSLFYFSISYALDQASDTGPVVLWFVCPFSIAITSSWSMYFSLFVYFARVNFCPFSLSLGVGGLLWLVIVALPGPFWVFFLFCFVFLVNGFICQSISLGEPSFLSFNFYLSVSKSDIRISFCKTRSVVIEFALLIAKINHVMAV